MHRLHFVRQMTPSFWWKWQQSAHRNLSGGNVKDFAHPLVATVPATASFIAVECCCASPHCVGVLTLCPRCGRHVFGACDQIPLWARWRCGAGRGRKRCWGAAMRILTVTARRSHGATCGDVQVRDAQTCSLMGDAVWSRDSKMHSFVKWIHKQGKVAVKKKKLSPGLGFVDNDDDGGDGWAVNW